MVSRKMPKIIPRWMENVKKEVEELGVEFALDTSLSKYIFERLYEVLKETQLLKGIASRYKTRGVFYPILSVRHTEGKIEIMFFNSYKIKETLKQHGYRWDRSRYCWYKIIEL